MAESGLRRLQRDLKTIQGDCGSSTVCVSPRGDDLSSLDALVIGPPDTPYDGALLHFQIQVSGSYPMNPPEVRFLTTESGKLRIHPQLYADGKVCLSILGTWHGPRWTASSSIRTVLLSIQSLLCEDPLRCEPGMEAAPDDKARVTLQAVKEENLCIPPLACIREQDNLDKPGWRNLARAC
ncbi:UBE2Z [Symbiodinium pilosum]|uniref:Ubiquitin-conjugating enzyme E2 Z n=1 Tax=Symbiodinium pilosum TaxID=2952 RepID=A0A812TCW6_SYMPI|nr:UBE2Z [Symbiodinium pilosum]